MIVNIPIRAKTIVSRAPSIKGMSLPGALGYVRIAVCGDKQEGNMLLRKQGGFDGEINGVKGSVPEPEQVLAKRGGVVAVSVVSPAPRQGVEAQEIEAAPAGK